MPLAGNKYYVQGFCLDKRKTSVTFVQSLFENSISVENKVVVTFKPGAKTSDFINLLPNGITIENDKNLTQQRITTLKPNVLYFNNTSLECYDMENRVINYLVVFDRESALIEDYNHTAFVIHHLDANDPIKLKNLLDSSKYIKFNSYATGEYYSFPLVNTHSSELKIKSEKNAPMYLSKYTPYRLEYSKVLVRFYEELEIQIPSFSVYAGSNIVGDTNSMDSDRITVTLEGIGDRERRPYMNDLDIIDSVAVLNLKVQTSDHLKYLHLKNSYQNLTAISNLSRFITLDTYNFEWLTHIEWEPLKDNVRMSEIRDESGRFSYTLDIRCSLYYYIVKDKMYPFIQYIDMNYVHLENNKGMNLTVT